jgi:hypothetical protein
MGYEVAINKAWDELAKASPDKGLSVKFLADEYAIDVKNRKVFSLSCNTPTKDFYAILILHYALRQLEGLPSVNNEWLSFRELSQVEGYYSAFRKRSIEPILRKYGTNPEALLAALERLPAKRVEQGDIGIVLEAFSKVPVMITLWRQDDEFSPEANMLFDKSIIQIFCTEDIVVLGNIVASQI